jgi:hypothetical protein
VRDEGRVGSQAVVIAGGVSGDGTRDVLGVEIGPSADGAFWLRFVRSLVARGLTGVQLVVSDAHKGLRQAIAAVLHGAGWQRCRVPFLRNALALVPKAAQTLAAAAIRTVFAQPTPAAARQQWRQVADGFRARWPRLACRGDPAGGGAAGRAAREWPVGRRSCGAESMARVRPEDAPPWRWRPTSHRRRGPRSPAPARTARIYTLDGTLTP